MWRLLLKACIVDRGRYDCFHDDEAFDVLFEYSNNSNIYIYSCPYYADQHAFDKFEAVPKYLLHDQKSMSKCATETSVAV
jgi:hypothetical protein